MTSSKVPKIHQKYLNIILHRHSLPLPDTIIKSAETDECVAPWLLGEKIILFPWWSAFSCQTLHNEYPRNICNMYLFVCKSDLDFSPILTLFRYASEVNGGSA